MSVPELIPIADRDLFTEMLSTIASRHASCRNDLLVIRRGDLHRIRRFGLSDSVIEQVTSGMRLTYVLVHQYDVYCGNDYYLYRVVL